jgi:hypothetical protein
MSSSRTLRPLPSSPLLEMHTKHRVGTVIALPSLPAELDVRKGHQAEAISRLTFRITCVAAFRALS